MWILVYDVEHFQSIAIFQSFHVGINNTLMLNRFSHKSHLKLHAKEMPGNNRVGFE